MRCVTNYSRFIEASLAPERKIRGTSIAWPPGLGQNNNKPRRAPLAAGSADWRPGRQSIRSVDQGSRVRSSAESGNFNFGKSDYFNWAEKYSLPTHGRARGRLTIAAKGLHSINNVPLFIFYLMSSDFRGQYSNDHLSIYVQTSFSSPNVVSTRWFRQPKY